MAEEGGGGKSSMRENLEKAAMYLARALEDSDCPVCDRFIEQEVQTLTLIEEMYETFLQNRRGNTARQTVTHSTPAKQPSAPQQGRSNNNTGPLRQFIQNRPRLLDLFGQS